MKSKRTYEKWRACWDSDNERWVVKDANGTIIATMNIGDGRGSANRDNARLIARVPWMLENDKYLWGRISVLNMALRLAAERLAYHLGSLPDDLPANEDLITAVVRKDHEVNHCAYAWHHRWIEEAEKRCKERDQTN